MSDDNSQDIIKSSNQSGEIMVSGQSQVTSGGDIVGRDKKVIAGTYIERATIVSLSTAILISEPPALGRCPFKGLQAFREEDAEYFCGREILIARLLDLLDISISLRLEDGQTPNRFVSIVGSSGSGKSSLILAGIIPALRHGTIKGSEQWHIHTITPTSHPLESLAISLTRHSESITATSTLIDDLAKDNRSLHLTALKRLSGENVNVKLLVVVDQFEELFTLCHNEDERKQFISNLLYAASVSGGQTIVLLRICPKITWSIQNMIISSRKNVNRDKCNAKQNQAKNSLLYLQVLPITSL